MLRLIETPEPDASEAVVKPKTLLTLPNVLIIARRQWPVIATCAAVGLVLAVAYVVTATSMYTASVKLMIDSRQNNLLRKNEIVPEQQPDATFVESQVEVLQSESVARTVIADLHLLDDPEFNGSKGPGPIGTAIGFVMGLFGKSADDSDSSVQDRLERTATQQFVKNVSARRLGLTYVIQVDYTSDNAAKSARIANDVANAYAIGELQAKYDATRRASHWLQDRLAELRRQATDSDEAVQAFKSENNIVDTSRGLMSEQQLSDVNSQIVQARAVTAEAKARLDRIREINGGDMPDATVTDALRNDVINRSRAQFLDLRRREADLSSKYGPNHVVVLNLRSQMDELKKSISDEVRRIAQTYESDYKIAQAREKSLQDSLDSLVKQAGTSSQAQVKLRELESNSQIYRNLYDSFMQKFEEATQQQTFPITDARVITPATKPVVRSSPKTLLALPSGLFLGLMLGFGIALARELLNTTLRTPADIEELGFASVGTLAKVPGTASCVNRYVIEEPFSRYAEVIRSLKVSIDVARSTRDVKVVGVVSALPREGKTTVSLNFAQLVAQAGHRVLLIDGDLRNPSLTRQVAPGAEAGLVEAISRSRVLSDLLVRDPVTGLDVLPAVVTSRMSNTAELVSSEAMMTLLRQLRGSYDYIFVDLPPLLSVVDTKAIASLIDAFFFVIKWNETSRYAVTEAIGESQVVRERTIGAILNQADPAALQRIEYHKGRHHDSYYHTEAA